jgi:UV DNA damage endonuclease
MKIGYPCINRSIGCTANSTFRLASYSKKKLIETVAGNLNCLRKILEYNVKNKLMFFRIGSQTVPFASHPICKYNWKKCFRKEFKETGDYIKTNKIRISMHPDQFVLINAKSRNIVRNSIKELDYHCGILDAMGLDSTAKVQIHVGGVYGDKDKSVKRFIENYKKLPAFIKKRVVIENDHRSYSLNDCISISQKIRIPVVFDAYHHECLNNGETLRQAIIKAKRTWKKKDGKLMVDYSSQEKGKKKGAHAQHINIRKFKEFLKQTKGLNFDMMLEIKDKERSALKAIKILK